MVNIRGNNSVSQHCFCALRGATYLVSQEESFELTFGPIIHGIGQQLHGERVHSQEVPNKHHSLDVLNGKRIELN